MDNRFLGFGGLGSYGGFGLAGLAINGRDTAKMTEADKERVIMECKDAASNEEIDEIMGRVGDDDSWGEIAEIISRTN